MQKLTMKPIPIEIKDFIHYDPDTGICRWKKDNGKKKQTGKEIKYTSPRGYRFVGFQHKTYLLHRVIWFIYYGEDPGDRLIDHKNGIRSDNRIENLRLVSPHENQHNRKVSGAQYHKTSGKWRSRIVLNSKEISLGYFDCPLMAGIAYHDAKRLYHPSSAR